MFAIYSLMFPSRFQSQTLYLYFSESKYSSDPTGLTAWASQIQSRCKCRKRKKLLQREFPVSTWGDEAYPCVGFG